MQTVVFVDFDPADGGHAGQVVIKRVAWAEGRGYHDAARRILAPSRADWLDQRAAEIGSGALAAGDKGQAGMVAGDVTEQVPTAILGLTQLRAGEVVRASKLVAVG